MASEIKLAIQEFLSPNGNVVFVNDSYFDFFSTLIQQKVIYIPLILGYLFLFFFLIILGAFSYKYVGQKKERLITQGIFWLIAIATLAIPAIVYLSFALFLKIFL